MKKIRGGRGHFGQETEDRELATPQRKKGEVGVERVEDLGSPQGSEKGSTPSTELKKTHNAINKRN